MHVGAFNVQQQQQQQRVAMTASSQVHRGAAASNFSVTLALLALPLLPLLLLLLVLLVADRMGNIEGRRSVLHIVHRNANRVHGKVVGNVSGILAHSAHCNIRISC